ncbi:MAG: hypothetical protein IPO17_05465 [Flavobacteriales bacterium]|nr:hypothetical protein [Flavobacteriales bacterium]
MSASFLAKLAPSLIALAFLQSCGGSGSPDTSAGSDDSLTPGTSADPRVMKLGGKLFSIPSPVQTALLIRKLGLEYSQDLVMSASSVDAMTTKTSKALAMGMYGADLAYLTMYKDGQRAVSTLQAIERLGNALDVGNAFDQPLMERFKNNLNNEDSLLQLGSEAYRAADKYLKTNDRTDVSALILAGGFVESLYLSTSSPGAEKDQDLANRIGEQKTTLTNLIGLLGEVEDQQGISTLTGQLQELRVLFTAISLTYEYAEPVTEEAKKTTYINSSSSVSITGDQLKAIAKKIGSIRNSILA